MTSYGLRLRLRRMRRVADDGVLDVLPPLPPRLVESLDAMHRRQAEDPYTYCTICGAREHPMGAGFLACRRGHHRPAD